MPVNYIQKAVQRVYRPPLGKSSCNHCIQKVNEEYEKQQNYKPVPSLAGTTKAGSSVGGQEASAALLSTVQSQTKFSENMSDMSLAQQAEYARAVLNGILRECDTTQVITKKQNVKTE